MTLSLFQTSFKFQEWDVRRPLHTNPSLDYLAPEYILSKSCNEMSDMYSYGMFAFTVYNQGKPIFENHNNMLSFKTHMEQVAIAFMYFIAGFVHVPSL